VNTRAKGGEVRSKLSVRASSLLFGVLALAVSGCGIFSGGVKSKSALLVSPSLAPTVVVSTEGDTVVSPAAEPVAAAVAAETRSETHSVAPPSAVDLVVPAPKPAFVPIALEPITPGLSPPLIASAAPFVPSAIAVPILGQRGKAEPLPDIQIEEYDPWEPFNEKMFAFNYNFDRYLLKPVAKGYNFVMPDRLQQMIDHGFDNIKVVPRLVNHLLQWNWRGFSTELGRFLINSTLGIGGLFDIARQEFNLEKPKGADLGVTLGRWGVEPGPYLILPLLPPLTVRDGIGFAGDGAIDPLNYVLPFVWDRFGMKVGETINDRSLNLDLFQGFEETTVDLYSAVRNGYLQRRYNLIHRPR
jgi:phospholipid-binding lipoprotein MlaA